MYEEPVKVDLETPNLAAAKRAAFEDLFPGVLADGVLDAGRLGELLDTEVASVVDGRERFGLMWAGKKEAVQSLLTPSRGTLIPQLDRSVDFDTAKNVFIEGDNLEVLKLLQKSYNDKVKLIYIDPPYNTSNDFVYNDDFTDGLRAYLDYSGQVDDLGNRMSATVDTAGRRHSSWLTMIYPRLVLARNLLCQDGIICISIDDNEVAHLRTLCDEVFGPENFLECFVWKRRYGGGPKEKYLVSIHEYILVYARNLEAVGPLFVGMESEQIERYYKLRDEKYEELGPYRLQPLEPAASLADRPNLRFPIKAPDGSDIWPRRQWLWSSDRVASAAADGLLSFRSTETGWQVAIKQYLRDAAGMERKTKLASIIDGIYGQTGSATLKTLFGGKDPFPFSKPWELVDRLVEVFTDKSSLVLDFFAGSGTTAQAVYQRNASDNGRRRWILVNLPEPTGADSVAERLGFKSVSEITRARARLVMDVVAGANEFGLRSLALCSSQFKQSGSSDGLFSLEKTTLAEPQIDWDAVAAEVLLKEGVTLDATWERREAGGAPVVVAGGVAVVLSTKLDDSVAAGALELGARVVVFLEDGFAGADAVKANAFTNAKNAAITMKTI